MKSLVSFATVLVAIVLFVSMVSECQAQRRGGCNVDNSSQNISSAAAIQAAAAAQPLATQQLVQFQTAPRTATATATAGGGARVAELQALGLQSCPNGTCNSRQTLQAAPLVVQAQTLPVQAVVVPKQRRGLIGRFQADSVSVSKTGPGGRQIAVAKTR